MTRKVTWSGESFQLLDADLCTYELAVSPSNTDEMVLTISRGNVSRPIVLFDALPDQWQDEKGAIAPLDFFVSFGEKNDNVLVTVEDRNGDNRLFVSETEVPRAQVVPPLRDYTEVELQEYHRQARADEVALNASDPA